MYKRYWDIGKILKGYLDIKMILGYWRNINDITPISP
jgi:hypothetical protein